MMKRTLVGVTASEIEAVCLEPAARAMLQAMRGTHAIGYARLARDSPVMTGRRLALVKTCARSKSAVPVERLGKNGPVWHAMHMEIETVTLWRPVGPEELALIRASSMRSFPPRLPDQPIFYPVLTEDYATKIARDWNAPRGGGYVTRFRVRRDFLDRYAVQEAGGRQHLEYWIPAEDLSFFNEAILGEIQVVAEFLPSQPSSA